MFNTIFNFLKLLFRVSRPRFWFYLGGTYIVGFAAGSDSVRDFLKPSFFIYSLFFFVIANIFLYGVNDYYDGDTDQFNAKKTTREHLLSLSEQKKISSALIIISLIFILLIFTAAYFETRLLFFTFFILSFFYSAPPVRFKRLPFLDFSSNILYGLPAFIGYTQLTHTFPSFWTVLTVFLWTSAMHLFSAIPDIESDQRAGLQTTAVVLGFKKALALCWALWLGCLVGTFFIGLYPFNLGGLLYLLLPIYVYRNPHTISSVYWYFPFINVTLGGVLFFKLFFF